MSGKPQAKSQMMCIGSAHEMDLLFRFQEATGSRKNGPNTQLLRASRPRNGMGFMILFFGMNCFGELLVFRVLLLDW
jgi:hypothetical protein